MWWPQGYLGGVSKSGVAVCAGTACGFGCRTTVPGFEFTHNYLLERTGIFIGAAPCALECARGPVRNKQRGRPFTNTLGCMRVSVATQTKGINRHFTREAVLMAVWVVVPLALGLVVALVGPWLVAGLR